MNNIVKVGKHEVLVKEFKGQRIVTFKDIDAVHERPEGTAGRNFRDNKKHFIEGEDYFRRNSSEAKSEFGIVAPNGLVLLTEQGYLMLVKSLTDDLSWKVQRQLVNSYFKKTPDTPKNKKVTQDRTHIMEMNARSRMAQMYLKLSQVDTLSGTYKTILVAKASEVLSGEQLLPLPKSERRVLSAGEIGDILGVSGNKIGRLANEHGLKVSEYGEFRRSKSEHSTKEVDTWVYFDSAIPEFEKILKSKEEV